MAWISNTSADKAKSREPVPEGTYSAEVINAIEKQTRTGVPMWPIDLRITDGPYKGAIIHDYLIFSERGVPKALAMFQAVGLTVSGGRDYQPSEITGRRCQVTTYVKEIEEEGFTRKVNQVPFSGYGPPIEGAGGHHGEPGM